MKLSERLVRLEVGRTHSAERLRRLSEDAEIVIRKLLEMAERLPVDAVPKTDQDLLTLSPAQHLAWHLRFDRRPASVGQIMKLHGFNMGGRFDDAA